MGEIKEAYYGIDHPETCLTLANLGMACSALGEATLARDCMQRALMACKMGDSANSRRHVMVLLRAATAHRALGEASKAEEFAFFVQLAHGVVLIFRCVRFLFAYVAC